MMHASIINSIEGSSPAQTGKTIGPASNDDSAKNALQAEDLIRLVVLCPLGLESPLYDGRSVLTSHARVS